MRLHLKPAAASVRDVIDSWKTNCPRRYRQRAHSFIAAWLKFDSMFLEHGVAWHRSCPKLGPVPCDRSTR